MRSTTETLPITANVMRIDTARQRIDIRQIDNRRFMYNPKTGILVLGRQYADGKLHSDHAAELAEAGITKGYDDFIRGWVGAGGAYPNGVIHFAPPVNALNMEMFNRAFDTLKMFAGFGAVPETVVRGFGRSWEQPLSSIVHLNAKKGEKQ